MLKNTIKYCSILLLIYYPIMTYFFINSNDPLNIMESQLSFSATTLKLEYLTIYTAGSMNTYRIAQIMDFGFMGLYGILLFAVSLKWSRILKDKKDKKDIWVKTGYSCTLFALIAAFCDVMENIFILMMISYSPDFQFPSSWAIIHSTFALIKWVLLSIIIGWYVIIRIKNR